MITAEQKPIGEIRKMIEPYKRILVLGCGSCVAECAAGGEKETGMLASALRMAAKMEEKEVVIHERTLDRQCVKDFVIQLDDVMDHYDAVLSLGCRRWLTCIRNGPSYRHSTQCSSGRRRSRDCGWRVAWVAGIVCSFFSAASAH